MGEPLERRAIISGTAQSDIGRRLYRSGIDLTVEAALRGPSKTPGSPPPT